MKRHCSICGLPGHTKASHKRSNPHRRADSTKRPSFFTLISHPQTKHGEKLKKRRLRSGLRKRSKRYEEAVLREIRKGGF